MNPQSNYCRWRDMFVATAIDDWPTPAITFATHLIRRLRDGPIQVNPAEINEFHEAILMALLERQTIWLQRVGDLTELTLIPRKGIRK